MMRALRWLRFLLLDEPDPAAAHLPGFREQWRLWLPDLLGVLALVLVSVLAFQFTNWDMALQRTFYSASGERAWPYADDIPWVWFYHFAPIPVALLALAGLGILLGSYWRPGLRRWRSHCLFVILVLAMGPGVVVNLLLKEQWGRPRPRQVAAFDGPWEYRQALDKGLGGRGKSFPCGHSSVGFVFVVFYFIFRRWRRVLGWLGLALALALGTLMGIGRMAAGAHWASDVAWSAIAVFATAWVLYYPVLNLAGREQAGYTRAFDRARERRHLVRLTVLVAGIILGALLATPVYDEIRHEHALTEASPPLVVEGPEVFLEIVSLAEGAAATQEAPPDWREHLRVEGTAAGFGWTGSKLRHRFEAEGERLRLHMWKDGLFTELVTVLKLTAPREALRDLRLDLHPDSEVRLVGPRPPGLQLAPGLALQQE